MVLLQRSIDRVRFLCNYRRLIFRNKEPLGKAVIFSEEKKKEMLVSAGRTTKTGQDCLVFEREWSYSEFQCEEFCET